MTPATANLDQNVRRSFGIEPARNGLSRPSLPFVNLNDLREMRDEAVQLLNRLTSARIESEQRCNERGKPDPMGFVTGRTCLEDAIEQTFQLIEEIDQFLARPQNGRNGQSVRASSNGQSFVSSGSP